MVDHVREPLLGYLLGALEQAERESVEDQLEKDPKLLEELTRLRESIDPLWLAQPNYDPPPDLVRRTCELVAAHPAPWARTLAAPAKKPAATPAPVEPIPEAASGGWGRFGSPVDVAVAAGIVVVLFLLAFPAIHNSRFNSRRFTCVDHLRQINMALNQYSETHDGYLPPVYEEGPHAGAGIYAPILVSYELLDGSHWFVCPGSPLADDPDFRVPSLDELAGASLEDLAQWRATMGGSYAYNLGFLEHGRYHTPRNLGRPSYPIVSDVPSNTLAGRQSANHGGRGQNVLKEDGTIDFCKTSKSLDETDDMFVNELGKVAAGSHRNDAVLAPSDALPHLERTVRRGTDL